MRGLLMHVVEAVSLDHSRVHEGIKPGLQTLLVWLRNTCSCATMLLMDAKRNPEQGGFTMLEVMIALTLLLIGVAGVLTMQMTSVKATGFSRHATEATILAEDKMEELMTVAAAALVDGTDTVDSKAIDDANGDYVRTWTVDPTGTAATVTVVVSWFEQGTDANSISLTTERRL